MHRELVLRAPVSGRLVQVEENLHAGRWLAKEQLIALVSSQSEHIVKGYVNQSQLARIQSDANGTFVPEDLSRSKLGVRLTNVSLAASPTIEIAELLRHNGGTIAATSGSKADTVPVLPHYQIELQPTELIQDPGQIIRGVILLRGKRQSVASKLWRQVAKVLVRESVF